MAFSYDRTRFDIPLNQIRLLIGDTNSDVPQLQDEEVAAAILIVGASSIYRAAAEAARLVAAKYAREVDSVNETLRQAFSQRMNRYLKLANDLEARLGIDPNGAMPSAGGVSLSDKDRNTTDGDVPQPAFWRGLNDNPANNMRPPGSDDSSSQTFTSVP